MVKSAFGRGLRDQTYWRAIKDVLRTLILEVRKSRKHLICTTEQKNVWQNYGSRDPNNPARIIGQTAKVLDPWLRYTDGILQLSRALPPDKEGKPRLSAAPFAQIDAFNPKNRLVGLPPRFEMSWAFLWKCVDERLIPTQQDMDKMVMVSPQAVENEEPAVPIQETDPKPEAEARQEPEAGVNATVVLCTQCERPITGGADKEGRPYTAQRMVEISASRAGSPLCYACYKAFKEFKTSTEQILGPMVIVQAVPTGNNGAH
jgi:hypothetical protein